MQCILEGGGKLDDLINCLGFLFVCFLGSSEVNEVL